MIPGSPLIWIAALGWLTAAGAYGFQKIKAIEAARAAYDTGYESGRASASAATVAAATATAAAEREAIDLTPLPASKAAIVELCRKRASCRERGKL